MVQPSVCEAFYFRNYIIFDKVNYKYYRNASVVKIRLVKYFVVKYFVMFFRIRKCVVKTVQIHLDERQVLHVFALLTGMDCRTCDLQVAGSSPGCAPLRSGLGQVTYTSMPLLPSRIIWYQPSG